MHSLPPVTASLDYGCGKLRYIEHILERTETLTVVDSNTQLSRTQQILGKKTSIRQLFSGKNNVRVLDAGEFVRFASVYDRAFCINTLSVIPIMSIRLNVIQKIYTQLAQGGVALFVVQYRNSDFSRMLSRPEATAWRGGILLNSLRGYSYYGLIPPSELKECIAEGGFERMETKLHDGSAYVFAVK
jgi:SAM-dependent methyltransferase